MKKAKKSLLVCVAALAMGGLAGCDFFTKPLDFSGDNTSKQEEQKQEEQPKDETVHVEDLSINFEELDLLIDEEKTLTATVTPANATNKAVTFKSSKETVATVSEAGVVKGIGEGTALITVQSVDNQAKFKTCVVSVRRSVIHVTDVVIGESVVVLTPGASSQLAASVLPADATNKNLIWESNNPSKVTVDQQGHIQALQLGEASITVQSEDNPSKFKTFTVIVEEETTAVSGVSLDRDVLALEENDDAVQLVATVTPADASNKAVFWTSSDQSVATVSQNGTVTPVKKGTTTITVKTMDGDYTATCNVTVTRVDVESFTLNETSLTFSSTATGDNAKAQLVATISPATATYQEVEWSSQDTTVATVSSSGLVQMVGVGTTVITALHVNSRSTASCVVNVVEPIGLEPVLPISTNAAYQAYKLHKQANPANPYAEFNDRTQLYEVGDDNKINLKPQFALEDANENVIDQNAWTFPFIIDVRNVTENRAANANEYSVINATTCDIQFKEDAVGDEFKVSIKLGGLTEEQYAEFEAQSATWQITAEYDVKVVDGYNVTNEIELGYLDTSTGSKRVRWFGHPDNGSREPEEWDFYNFSEFKASHNLKQDYTPATLVLHKDMRLTKDHLPAEIVYSEANAVEAGWDAKETGLAVGSLRDEYYFYGKYDDGKMTLSGNYFTLDWSAIPLVKRTSGYTSYNVKPESHASFMKVLNGDFEIKNINFIGNAHTAADSGDVRWAGGLTGFKVRDKSNSFKVHNVLGHGCYMTFMNEGYYQIFGGDYGKKGSATDFEIKDCKFFDNYNTFLYNWGGTLVAENTAFEGCGGPVVIQDHVISSVDHNNNPNPSNPAQDVNNYYSFQFDGTSQYQFKEKGAVSRTKFIDCEFQNYVLGTEAWFASFGADALTQTIKQMCDLIAGYGNKYSAIYDANHAPSTYASLSANNKPSLFNFIVINKSGRMAGLSNCQVNGDVEFYHRDNEGNLGTATDAFNYRAPAVTGDEFTTVTAQAIESMKFRGIGRAGAPVFETAGGIGFYNPAVQASYLLDVNSTDPANNPDILTSTSIGTNAHEYMTLYYQGMMLVMKLAAFGA